MAKVMLINVAIIEDTEARAFCESAEPVMIPVAADLDLEALGIIPSLVPNLEPEVKKAYVTVSNLS